MGYIVAKYIRLSQEDAKTDSLSIENQRLLIDKYIRHMGLENTEVVEYVDNGFSGTNLDRPGLQQLLEKVRTGSIRCVVVKDLSRLGRNLVDMGYFTETLFPQHGVRFVAITDCYDSGKNTFGTSDFTTIFRFMVNEQYSHDLSRKMKSAKAHQQELGEAVSKNCVFGYRLDENRKMVVDEDAAQVVRRIYDMTLEGLTPTKIAQRFYREGIISPGARKKLTRGQEVENSCVWSPETILHILRDEQYTGIYVAGKTKRLEVGSRRQIAKNSDEWIRIPDHHVALVNQDDFDAVQRKAATRKREKAKRIHYQNRNDCQPALPLKGLTTCGHCGHLMQVKASRNPSLYCRFTRVADDAECHGLSVLVSELEEKVLEMCRERLKAIASFEKECELQVPTAKRSTNEVRSLYERMIGGEIGIDDFNRMKVTAGGGGVVSRSAVCSDDADIARKLLESADLTDEMVVFLIKGVSVFADGGIDVVWKE